MVYSFVILHYKNRNVTINCINSILMLYKSASIVVVDNASCDGSGESLLELYSETNNVIIIILKDSKGFSYGNNIGCRFAVSRFSPDFVVVCNSDTVFIDSEMLDKIDKIYLDSGFAILGPDVYLAEKREHQSPFRCSYMTIRETQKEIRYYKRKRFITKLLSQIYKSDVYIKINRSKILLFIRNLVSKVRLFYQHKKMKCDVRQINVCLYGACMIFSKKYYSCFVDFFSPETTFYCEEDILLLRCITNDLLVLYDPTITVNHIGKGSTYNDDIIKCELWRIENLINSRYIYMDYLESLGLNKSVNE